VAGPDGGQSRREGGGQRDSTAFAVLLDGELIGLVQYYEELDPTVRTIARHLVHDRGHHRLIVDPTADNERAIRFYEKVGFRPVGVLREYQRAPDGIWHDGVLLDLLARELD
jgi:aminoglycoside 6'-N-acetyltransferase